MLIGCAFAGTFFLTGCASETTDPWDDVPVRKNASGHAATSKKAHLDYILSRMVLVEMSDSGEIRFDGEILSREEFSKEIRARGKLMQGKPVLLWYNPEATSKNTGVVGFIVRECLAAGLGKIYTEVPEEL